MQRGVQLERQRFESLHPHIPISKKINSKSTQPNSARISSARAHLQLTSNSATTRT
jgi:hypothetical protein